MRLNDHQSTHLISSHYSSKTFTMIIRSVHPLAVLICISLVCLITVWHRSPWTTADVYERLSSFKNSSKEPLQDETTSLPWISTFDTDANGGDTSIPQNAPWWPQDLKAYVQAMMTWERPTWTGWWPPFADYIDKAYDPNRWEAFDA
jgi:hypothetical protein